jgi:dGTPase
MIGALVADLLAETERRIRESRAQSAEEIRGLAGAVAGFSERMRAHDAALKLFLSEHMYRHYKLNRMTSKARRVVRELCRLLVTEPECLPTEWRRKAEGPGTAATAHLVADYVAGMTDRYALDEYRRLFDVHARTS